MHRWLLPVVAATSLFLTACPSTNTPPSTANIAERNAAVYSHVVSASETSAAADRRVTSAHKNTVAASGASKGVGSEIDQSIIAVEAHDYTTAAQHLVKAKAGSGIVQLFLEQTLADLTEARQSLDSTKVELGAAKVDNNALKLDAKKLQVNLDKQTKESASDHSIAARCKSWFGLGALFYGIETLLKAGILGCLILGVTVIALTAAGYFVGGPFGSIVLKLAGQARHFILKRKDSNV